jgi:hypothetical protein
VDCYFRGYTVWDKISALLKSASQVMETEKEHCQKMTYIGLRNQDSSLMLNVPPYVRVVEVNGSGMIEMQRNYGTARAGG